MAHRLLKLGLRWHAQRGVHSRCPRKCPARVRQNRHSNTECDRVSRAQVALVEEQLMARLRETVEGAGGRLDPGWGVEVRVWLSVRQQVGRAAMCMS